MKKLKNDKTQNQENNNKMKIPNIMSAKDAVKLIKSGDRVLIQGASATPQTLVKAMVARAPELRDVEIVHLHTEGECGYVAEELKDSFHTNAFFIGGNVRKMVGASRTRQLLSGALHILPARLMPGRRRRLP